MQNGGITCLDIKFKQCNSGLHSNVNCVGGMEREKVGDRVRQQKI